MGLIRLAIGLLIVFQGLLGTFAYAQSFPAKTVRLIVPFPPGQATDIVARLLAERLNAVWNQSVIVDNRAGGGGVPGLLAGRDASPDGYTITLGTSGTLGINPGIYAKLAYDPQKDFAMVGGVFAVPLMFVAHPSFPYQTIKELVEGAKKSPGTINWAIPGTGTSQHLTGELFKFRAGVNLQGIPYKGSGPGMADLLGGQVTLMLDSLASALPHVKAGKIRAIAMTTAQRVPQLPEVPTVAEAGFAGFEGVGWGGLIVPMATPKDIVEKIGTDVRKILLDPAMQARIADRGAIADPRGPAEFTAFVREEIAKWGDIAKRANIKAD
ncbi:MAG: tripartite tricarboxylate transporter substrate binding protein [Betaproteobacteria bacterium]|nr:tripartite tricarboxylate transporter substrate binding protein [Betaproteobacteria bacterium]